jgi:hypothetical protein
VRVVAPADLLDKMVYVYSTPVAADLVDAVDDWPGVSSFHAAMTTGLVSATRPAHFFRSDGDQPDAIDVPIYRPRGFVDMTPPEWRTLVQGRVRTAEIAHRERRRATGKSVLGRAVPTDRCHRPVAAAPRRSCNAGQPKSCVKPADPN